MELGESVAARAVAGAQPLDLADDQAGVLEHLQVLRDGRLRERQLVDELAAVAGVAAEQQPQDPDAGRVAERLREQRELLVALDERPEPRRRLLTRRRRCGGGAAAAIPAGTPRSGFTCGISCGQP